MKILAIIYFSVALIVGGVGYLLLDEIHSHPEKGVFKEQDTVDLSMHSDLSRNYDQQKNTSNMKQCTIQFPKSKAREVAKFLAENSIITNLSWMESGDFFSTQVTAIICFPDDKEDKVKANLQKYIKDGQ